jgi:hypothetical protein
MRTDYPIGPDLVCYRLKQLSAFLLPLDQRERLTKRWLFDFELGRAPIVFVSAAKSGRTWIRVMLSKVWQDRYQAPSDQMIHFDNYHRHDARIPIILWSHSFTGGRGNPTKMIRRASQKFKEKKLIYLFRNPRDVVVSAYYARTHRPQDNRRRNPIERSLTEFVTDADDGLPAKVRSLNYSAETLPDIPSRLVLQYEALRADPSAGLRRIGEFLNMNLTEAEIAAATAYADFENMQDLERRHVFSHFEMRPADLSDPNSFKVRRGKIGGYRDELSPDVVAWMDEYVGQNLSDFFPYAAATKTA